MKRHASQPLTRLAYVEWFDSMGGDHWQPLDANRREDLRCRSVGWILREDHDGLTLVPHIATEGAQGRGVLTIPRVSITAIINLRPPRRRHGPPQT